MAANPNEEGRPRRTPARVVGEVLLTLAAAIAAAALIRAFVAESFIIPSGSMLDTLQIGDRLIGEKVSYRLRDPEQGEIVTFWRTEADGTRDILIKRVIATEGQTVDLADGAVYVDGVALEEPYTEGKPSYSLSDSPGSAGIAYPYTVPAGCIFVMGDNRTNSSDSRYFGPVSVDDVTSRAVFIYWPPADAATL